MYFCNRIHVNKLLDLDPVEKYLKTNVGVRTVSTEKSHAAGKAGKTLVKGYVNRNNQENRGCLNKPETHYNQKAYLLHCNECGFEYEANGCDVAIRRCPRCQ